MKKAADKTISELNSIYEKAEQVDKSHFAEIRSNILLAIGEHYSKKNSKFWGTFRDTVQLAEDQKLRLTKNHIHRICNIYQNNILALAPGVAILPKKEKELRDQKSAELNEAVWRDWKNYSNYREQVRLDAGDFVRAGEVAAKIYFDPAGGEFIGYKQKLDEMGQPLFDENGYPQANEDEPVFQGAIVYERIFPANLLREKTSKDSLKEGMVIIRKMVDVELLRELYKDDEKKLKFIQNSKDSVYTVFDNNQASYGDSKEETMVREFYQPPSPICPRGYFWIATELGILEQGELPYGIWPIIFTGMDDVQTTPRKRSIIKVARPYQAEINRAASKIAETQITSDDKLMCMAGSKITQAAKMPGIRVMNYTGQQPVYLAGRSGEQYLPYVEAQVRELYQAVNLEEEVLDKSVQATDQIAELLKIARNKKKFSLYASKFEDYQVQKAETVLKIAKAYYDENHLIPAIGRGEFINIQEFKTSTPLCYRIALEPTNEDYETRFGKHITFSTVLQYVGNKLEKDDIGKILRAMPYANNEKIFDDFTLNYDIATNMILALDRGEYPVSRMNYDHKYIINRLGKRTTEPDFQFLPEEIQQNYERKLAEHKEMETQYLLQIKQAQSELIPATGPLVKVDMYVNDPENPAKVERARLPIDALRWLEKRLRVQGIELEELSKIQNAQVADMANQFLERLGNGQEGQLLNEQPMAGNPQL